MDDSAPVKSSTCDSASPNLGIKPAHREECIKFVLTSTEALRALGEFGAYRRLRGVLFRASQIQNK